MQRVVLLAPNLAVGGAERVVVELCASLPRERFDVHLVLLSARGEFLDEVPDDIPVTGLGVERGRRAMAALVRHVRSLRPAVVQSHLPQATLPLLAARPALPRATRLIPTEHQPLSALFEQQRRPGLWRSAHRVLYRRAEQVVAVSDAVAEDVRDVLGPRVPVTTVVNPVPEIDPPEAAPKTGSGPHVVAVGRLVPQKGLDRLLGPFAAVVAQRPDAHLTIVGAGPERARLEAAAAARGLSGVVSFVGHRSDARAWIAHASVVVSTAHVEGMSLVQLEALAAGTPVVAYDGPGGTRELLTGLEGTVLVPDGDGDALARAIVSALDGAVPSPHLPDRFTHHAAIEGHARVLAG